MKECLTGMEEDPSSIPRKEVIFFTCIPFEEEMRQMAKNKNNLSQDWSKVCGVVFEILKFNR